MEKRFILCNIKSYGSIHTVDRTFSSPEEAIQHLQDKALDYKSWFDSGITYVAELQQVIGVVQPAVPPIITAAPLQLPASQESQLPDDPEHPIYDNPPHTEDYNVTDLQRQNDPDSPL